MKKYQKSLIITILGRINFEKITLDQKKKLQDESEYIS